MTIISSVEAKKKNENIGTPPFIVFFLKANIDSNPQRIGIVR